MTSKTKLDHWCEAIIEAGWLAVLVVAPMFFNVFSSRVFEPDKISLGNQDLEWWLSLVARVPDWPEH
jgi:hypothetical protein